MKESGKSDLPALVFGLICVGCFVFGQTLARMVGNYAVF